MTPADPSAQRPIGRCVVAGGATLGAFGGVAAQGSQAAGSFVLQILAARLLGLEGLGRFAALYAIIVLATALCSGFVGDSLTVLDRSRDDVRSGLQAWLGIISLGAGASCAIGSWMTGFLSGAAALAFGSATVVFLVEDALRRLLMAKLQFWRIVVVDLAGLAGSAIVVAVVWAFADRVTLAHFLTALMLGQLVATVAAIAVIPSAERRLDGRHGAALAEVAAYGIWRAAQQAVRPALLASMRVVCLVTVSTAAVGALEAARIYIAPAMLAVGGVSSFLFASYASQHDTELADLVRLADRSVVALLSAITFFGIAAVLLIPWLGPLLTDDRYDLSTTAVAGWVAYAASVAAVTPYGQLAAVRGRQTTVLAWRIGDSALSLITVVLFVSASGSVNWVPFILAIGSLAGGLSIRQLVLRRELGSAGEVTRADLRSV